MQLKPIFLPYPLKPESSRFLLKIIDWTDDNNRETIIRVEARPIEDKVVISWAIQGKKREDNAKEEDKRGDDKKESRTSAQ